MKGFCVCLFVCFGLSFFSISFLYTMFFKIIFFCVLVSLDELDWTSRDRKLIKQSNHLESLNNIGVLGGIHGYATSAYQGFYLQRISRKWGNLVFLLGDFPTFSSFLVFAFLVFCPPPPSFWWLSSNMVDLVPWQQVSTPFRVPGLLL